MTPREPAIAAAFPSLYCWEIEYAGITAYVAHYSRGGARMFAAHSIDEAGYADVSKALIGLKCRRAAWCDLDATLLGRPGFVDPFKSMRQREREIDAIALRAAGDGL